MKKRNGANALVCEMLIVSLLFALSATVILRVFSAAYQESERAGAAERALCAAQNMAERFRAGDGFEAYLQETAVYEDGVWRVEGDGYTLETAFSDEETQAGVLRRAQVRALCGGETVATLPCARYESAEANQ